MFFNGMQFDLAGATASGAPYYRSLELDQYIYYDPSCNGHSDTAGRWVIDVGAPDLTRGMDLDRDGACNYHARSWSNDTFAPPRSYMWRVYCDGSWQDVWLDLEVLPTTTPKPPQISGAEGYRHYSAIFVIEILLVFLGSIH